MSASAKASTAVLAERISRVLQGIRAHARRGEDEFALATQFKKAVDAITDEDCNRLIIVHNGLRHSFTTYLMAVLKNAAQVASEAGNSPRMNELVSKAEANG